MKPVLLINDDESIVREVSRVLEGGNYHYMVARDGYEALNKARGYDFSLVLLDLKLPDVDGDVLYQKLLDAEYHYTLPVVALVDSMDADEVKIVNSLLPRGKVTLLSKPLKREWLEELFEQYGEKK